MVLNQQRRIRVPITALTKFLSAAQKRLRLPSDSLTVALVTDAQIARWNRAYRGKNQPTDVLSFPSDGPRPHTAVRDIRGDHARPARRAPERKRGGSPASSISVASPASFASYLGDIAIAPAVARRNALRFGRTFDQEMCILVLHGVLHLMGYDHETDQGQMSRRENRLRRELGLA